MADASSLVSIQRRSANGKLSPVKMVPMANGRPRPVPIGPFVASTYVSIEATCPDTCPFKGNGCYAEAASSYNGLGGMEAEPAVTSFLVTHAETLAVDALYANGVPQIGARGGMDLRLHVGGDVSCEWGARLLAASAAKWAARGGGAVWTYTARWREFRRKEWGSISVLASIQKVEDIKAARKMGYVPAITMPYFPSRKPFRVPSTGDLIIPCLAETRGKTCVECRLCLDDDKLRRHKIIIGFALHGRDAKRAKKRLRVIQGPAFDAVPLELVG